MNLNTTTAAFLIAGVIVIALFDLFQIVRKGYDSTLSYTLWAVAKSYPIVPFVFGVIAGHLFWSQVC